MRSLSLISKIKTKILFEQEFFEIYFFRLKLSLKAS